MRPTSLDLRKRIVAARIEDGQSMGEIARRFKVPKGTVQNVLERYRDARTVEPKPQNAGRKPAFSGTRLRRLEQDVLHHPDATLEELLDRSGLNDSRVALHHTLEATALRRTRHLHPLTRREDVHLDHIPHRARRHLGVLHAELRVQSNYPLPELS